MDGSHLSPTHVHVWATPAPTDKPVAEEEEYYSSWSLFLVCVLLIISLWTSYYLQIKRIRVIHETLVSIFAGMFVGLIVRLAPGNMIREMLTFKHTLFFNLLLPPIILNSGYELKQENFFRNFGSILTFAFFGTFISAVGVGILVYIWSMLGLESLDLGLIECLVFGSTLSATDPVTILAIFNQYKVDPKLYTIIFGESLLNDAVSIVMYETLTKFHGSEIHVLSIFHGIGIFLATFGISMALGVVFGLGVSLLLKHSSLNHYPHIETSLVALAAYTSYFLSNGLNMSGIVSLLFCGITLKHYAYHTMSRRTQRATKYIFSTLAQLTENFIFIYLGLSLFTSAPSSEPVTHYVKPLFIVVTTVAVTFTRYAAVFPLSEMINFFHKHARGQRNEEIPHSYQMMLFWAGLRGAVGVALAAGFPGDNAQPLRTTVLVVVVLTVVLFGGTTARMLEVLGIRTGVEDEAASSTDEEFGSSTVWPGRNNGRNPRNRRSPERFYSPQRGGGASRIGLHYGNGPRSYNHQFQHQQSTGTPGTNQNIFSAASSESYDSDGEVLPMATTNVQPGGDQNAGGSNAILNSNLSGPQRGHEGNENGGEDGGVPVVEEGKWFQELDERYLLPLFSNATASRTFHARRARRSQQSGMGSPFANSPMDSEDDGEEGEEVDLGGGSGGGGVVGGRRSGYGGRGSPAVRDEARFERGLSSPMLRRDSEGHGNRAGP